MNSNLIIITNKAQKQNEVINSDGSFGFSLSQFTEDLFSYIKLDLLNLDITQETKNKITAYFAEDV
jgi:hypothetical protein